MAAHDRKRGLGLWLLLAPHIFFIFVSKRLVCGYGTDKVMINLYYGPVQVLDVVTIVTYTKEDWYAVRPTNQL